jgi:hypothetical protein
MPPFVQGQAYGKPMLILSPGQAPGQAYYGPMSTQVGQMAIAGYPGVPMQQYPVNMQQMAYMQSQQNMQQQQQQQAMKPEAFNHPAQANDPSNQPPQQDDAKNSSTPPAVVEQKPKKTFSITTAEGKFFTDLTAYTNEIKPITTSTGTALDFDDLCTLFDLAVNPSRERKLTRQS